MHSKAGMWHHVGSTMKIVRNTLFLVGNERQRGRKRKITHYFIGHSDSGHTRRRKSFAASRYLCMVKISGFQIAQFRKRRGKQWNKGCKQGGNPYATDRGTAMAVCLEKRSGKSNLTAVSAEDGGA